MNKKVFECINLTCVFQRTNDFKPSAGTNGEGANVSEDSNVAISGIISPGKDGGILFQETMPRKRDIRNNRLYEGKLLNIVRRKNGCYYPFMKAFRPNEIEDKSAFAFRVYQEISEALNTIE